MKNIKLYENIKMLFNGILKKDNKEKELVIERQIDEKHGFQMLTSDVGEYLKHFLTKEQLQERINNINNLGYMAPTTGMMLKSILDNNEYDTYIKSVASNDVDSIMQEGIRCLGTTSSQATTNPDNINDISLQNTVTKVDDLTILVELIKRHNGLSQGFNIIDGTLILQIPKNTPKEELFCYNESSKTYNIKPEFIIGFIPVDENHNVKGLITSLQEIKEKKTM